MKPGTNFALRVFLATVSAFLVAGCGQSDRAAMEAGAYRAAREAIQARDLAQRKEAQEVLDKRATIRARFTHHEINLQVYTRELNAIDISGTPPDFQAAWLNYMAALAREANALGNLIVHGVEAAATKSPTPFLADLRPYETSRVAFGKLAHRAQALGLDPHDDAR